MPSGGWSFGVKACIKKHHEHGVSNGEPDDASSCNLAVSTSLASSANL